MLLPIVVTKAGRLVLSLIRNLSSCSRRMSLFFWIPMAMGAGISRFVNRISAHPPGLGLTSMVRGQSTSSASSTVSLEGSIM